MESFSNAHAVAAEIIRALNDGTIQLPPATPWLTPDEAAVYLRTTKKALAHKRVAGTGPRFCIVGRVVRYNRADLDAWLEGGAS